jgi:hypothetical protein
MRCLNPVAWLGSRYLLATPVRRLTDLERCNADLTPKDQQSGADVAYSP